MIRAAVVGFGWWGRTIASRLANSEAIRVVHVVDGQAAARGAAAEMGFGTSETLEAALALPDITAFIIATPNSFHEAQVTACAKAGKHVFCEKPLGLNLSSARRSMQACEEAGVVLGIGHERRFEPALEALRELVVTGKLGTILHAEAAFSHDKLVDLPRDNWRKDNAENPAGGMTACGVHLTDFLIWTLGPVDLVSSMLVRTIPSWDTGVSCQLGFKNGTTATLSALLATPHYIKTRVFGSTAWAEVVNDVHPDSPDGETRLIVQRTGQSEIVTTYQWVDTVTANFEEFAAAIAGRGRYRFTRDEILHNVGILEAVTLSARQNRTMRVTPECVEPAM